MTMNNTDSTPKSKISLAKLLQLSIFGTIYAKGPLLAWRNPKKTCPSFDPSSTPGPCDEGEKSTCGSKATDCGRVGACLSGSRVEQSKDEDLPCGATYPGLLRYVHNAARMRLPQCFEGAFVTVQQGVSCNWFIGHTMSFSSVTPGGYKMSVSRLDKCKPVNVPYFVLETAPGGQMSCEARVGPTRNTRAIAVAQIADSELHSLESIIDVYFNSLTASIIAVNREFIALHCLQAVTEKLSVGAEMVMRGPGKALSSVSGAARWANENNSLSATLGNRGLELCYARVMRPYLTVAAMLEMGFAIDRTVGTLAYEWKADQWTVRASADSDGLVGATVQHSLGGKRSQLVCAISALLNHPNDKFRLGFGITAALV